MSCFFAFLRAINVGGNNKIPMADLRSMMEGLGMKNVRTLLQSGNVVFEAPGSDSKKLEKKLEDATRKTFDVNVDFMVRTTEQLAKTIKANPFPKEAKNDPGHLLVLFLKDDAAEGAEEELRSAIKGREVVVVKGDVAYAIYSDGVGVSKLTNAVLEKKLGTRATGRNWNTVTKLLAMTEG